MSTALRTASRPKLTEVTPPATRSVSAGLYAARRGEIGASGSIEIGWVVLADGTQGGSTQLVDPQGGVTLEAAPPLTPSNDPVASPPAVRVGGTELKPTKILEPADLGR
jgi:hypothetical protein